jgi:hypothetical protein
MHPSDVPTGYVERWRKIISVYPPVDTQTMASALGNNVYPGGMPFPTAAREVRLNAEKGRIEIWERRIEQAQPQRPTFSRGAATILGTPGTINIQ